MSCTYAAQGQHMAAQGLHLINQGPQGHNIWFCRIPNYWEQCVTSESAHMTAQGFESSATLVHPKVHICFHTLVLATKTIQAVCSAQIRKSTHTSCFDLTLDGSAAQSHSIYQEAAVYAQVADSA